MLRWGEVEERAVAEASGASKWRKLDALADAAPAQLGPEAEVGNATEDAGYLEPY